MGALLGILTREGWDLVAKLWVLWFRLVMPCLMCFVPWPHTNPDGQNGDREKHHCRT